MKSWFSITARADTRTAEIDIFDEIGLYGVSVKDFAAALKSVPADSDITLRINSPGGSVFDGHAIFNLLAERRERVTARVIGLAASMASIIMLAARRTVAAANATIMIHNPVSMAAGGSREMRDTADLLDKIRGQLVSAYARKTGKTDEEIAGAMDATTWFTAQEALAWGLIDEIAEPVQVAASFDLSRFGRLPQAPQGAAPGAPARSGDPIRVEENGQEMFYTAQGVLEMRQARDAALGRVQALEGEAAAHLAAANQAGELLALAHADLEKLRAELAAIVAERDISAAAAASDLAAARVEIDRLSAHALALPGPYQAEIATLRAELARRDAAAAVAAAIADGKIAEEARERFEAMHIADRAHFDEIIAAIVPRRGAAPVPAEDTAAAAASADARILAEYRALSGAAKIDYFRKHSDAIWRAASAS